MNIILRDGGYPGIAIMSDEEYTRAVSRSLDAGDDQIFEKFLANKLCQKTQKWKTMHSLYGEDIQQLAFSCMQKTKQYYFSSYSKESKQKAGSYNGNNSTIKECKESFSSLIKNYNTKNLVENSSKRMPYKNEL